MAGVYNPMHAWTYFQIAAEDQYKTVLKDLRWTGVLLNAWHERAEKSLHPALKHELDSIRAHYTTLECIVKPLRLIFEPSNGILMLPAFAFMEQAYDDAQIVMDIVDAKMVALGAEMQKDKRFGGEKHGTEIIEMATDFVAWWEKFEDLMLEAQRILKQIEGIEDDGDEDDDNDGDEDGDGDGDDDDEEFFDEIEELEIHWNAIEEQETSGNEDSRANGEYQQRGSMMRFRRPAINIR